MNMIPMHFIPGIRNFSIRLTLLLIAAALAACGSGTAADITGTGGKSASDEGEVEGFSSVIVNGTRYATTEGTEFLVEGNDQATETDLELGMVVEVEVAEDDLGVDGAVARRIIFRSALRGRIDSVDAERKSFSVLGLTIHTDPLTRLLAGNRERIRFSSLEPGDSVQVSGHRRGDGNLLATLVRRADPDPEGLIVRGRVSELDTASQRFSLGRLRVDFSGAESFEVAELQNGDFVEVAGEPDRSTGELDARRVTELRDAEREPPPRRGLQGIVSHIDGSSACPTLSFRVNEQAVRTTAQTRYQGGSCEDIEIDRRIGVFGRADDDGRLVAEAIALPPPVDALLLAQVEAIAFDSATTASTAPCTIRVLGDLFIQVNADTRQGVATQQDSGRGFTCRDVQAGDLVAAAGRFDDSGERDVVDAALLQSGRFGDQSTDMPDITILAGRVQSISPQERRFSLLGTTVQTDDNTDFQDSSEAQFYANTAAGEDGDFVAVIGQWNGAVVRAFAVAEDFERDFE